MKKLFYFLFMPIIFNLSSYECFGQTTLEEYNYLSKGYKIQLESGLDMKKGYIIKDISETNETFVGGFERTVLFKHLYRENESKPCATLMIQKRPDTGYIEYFCIPHKDSSLEIWQKARVDYNRISNNYTESSAFYSWAMIKMISELSSI